MTDTRRLGHAQRRRMGAPANVYADTLKAPEYGVGDQVKVPGRYGPMEVVGIIHNVLRPGDSDGHGYVVRGGKGGRESIHLSSDLRTYVSEEISLG